MLSIELSSQKNFYGYIDKLFIETLKSLTFLLKIKKKKSHFILGQISFSRLIMEYTSIIP